MTDIFNIGTVGYTQWYGTAGTVEIIKYYPITDRYRVKLFGALNKILNIKMIDVNDFYISENDFWESQVAILDFKISYLEQERQEFVDKIKEE